MTNEVIEEIKEDLFYYENNPYDGFSINTNKQCILIGISNEKSCCELWGYFISNDDLQDFIGASILDINIVDECLNVKKLKDNCDIFFEGKVIFINIETSNGTLQFTAYNSHNGYYGHEVVVIASNEIYIRENI